MLRPMLILMVCLPCVTLDAADGEPAPDAESPPQLAVPPSADELAGMSRGQLRRALVDAEDAVYRVFNDLNTDDEYDIICKNERRVTSHFSRRVCKARIFREAVEESGWDFRDEGVHRAARLDEGYHAGVLRRKMHDLAGANPQLAAALNRHRALQQAYEARQN